MLDQLLALIRGDDLPAMLGRPDLWDSLVIDRRKPVTLRAFATLGGGCRVCLHRFHPCASDEAFFHPHPWPGAFFVLDGAYRMRTGLSPDLHADAEPLYESVYAAGSGYEITHPRLWHAIMPVGDGLVHTVMLNGPVWPPDQRHARTVTTQGKDLKQIDPADLPGFLAAFAGLVARHRGAA